MVKALFAKFWEMGQAPPRGRAYYDRLLPQIPFVPKQGIPRQIHQIYHDTNQLALSLKNNISAISALNPDYQHKLWDFVRIEDFIFQHYGEEVLSIYRKITPEYIAARADLARYLIIYALGGVYLDVKSSFAKPLSEVIRNDDSCILSHWDNLPGQAHESFTTQHAGLESSPRGEFVQWYLAYQAGHPLLREIIIEVLSRIDNYNPFVRSIGRGGVLDTTGPIPYSLTVLRYRETFSDIIRVEELPNLGFVYSIYETAEDPDAHKRVMPSNYWRITSPLVSSPNIFIQIISKSFIRLWYGILAMKACFSETSR